MISKGNHVKFARFVLLAFSEEAKNIFFRSKTFFFRSMYNKTIISLGKGYQPQPSASADSPYLDLDYSGYHKKLIQYLFSKLQMLCERIKLGFELFAV